MHEKWLRHNVKYRKLPQYRRRLGKYHPRGQAVYQSMSYGPGLCHAVSNRRSGKFEHGGDGAAAMRIPSRMWLTKSCSPTDKETVDCGTIRRYKKEQRAPGKSPLLLNGLTWNCVGMATDSAPELGEVVAGIVKLMKEETRARTTRDNKSPDFRQGEVLWRCGDKNAMLPARVVLYGAANGKRD